jgi:hypothetical protein
MKIKIRKPALSAVPYVVAVAAFISSCGLLEVAGNGGGSSSEVVAMVGSARNGDGSAASNAVVRLRPAGYLSAPGATGTLNASVADVKTDGGGAFRIDSVAPGAYTLEIAGRLSSGAARVVSATLDSEEIRLDPMVLKPVAGVSGTARLPAGLSGPVYIMVYGLERRTLADSSGKFTLSDLPEGRFTLRISPTAAGAGPCDLTGIATAAGSTESIDTVTLHTFADEDYSTWASNLTVRINTSASGADVGTTIAGFPLLVRLDANNFDFTTSRSYQPGSDVRFAGVDGRHLPCQIERWDASLRKAEIWVRVDSMIGNDSTQFIRMYCGNPAAASWTGRGTVFDTAAGFAAVWHLGSDLHDATVNSNNGSPVKTTIAEGVIGTCTRFDGAASFIAIDSSLSLNMGGKGPTVLLWQRTTQPYQREQMYFEHDVWPQNGDYGFSTRTNTTLSFDYPSADSEVRYSGTSLSDDAWHLVAASKDAAANRGTIYLDGEPVASGPMRAAIGSSSGRSAIGSRGGTNRFFEGYIDEMWIMKRPLGPDAVKLIYENQRPGQKLVSVRR